MLYLAQPYSHPDAAMRDRRYELASGVCALLMKQGLDVYAPIIHWHAVANRYKLPTDAEFWLNHNKHMIEVAAEVAVLNIDGWKESVGVKEELKYCQTRGKITYLLQIVTPIAQNLRHGCIEFEETSPKKLLEEIARHEENIQSRIGRGQDQGANAG